MKLKTHYLILGISLLIIEIIIALYINSGFIRHTFGDYLVVILLYCTIKSFVKIRPTVTAIGVLTFSYFIEFLQYLNIVNLLNLQDNKILRIIIGTTFNFSDLIAYTLGILTVLILEIKVYYHE
ncbi:ribosomal maturation YjgA family protein [Aestuariibaculum suncheonense]|uniref:DUF2809 domain-containing protein n=1 Tax=Aestuariibaculum suncheonense TaxID=1028745 RepID=A0A8J6Q4Y1_9FLAO|nr:DUF2809 domain-containing protein [Aestuariibaculum suncheonense]